MPVTKSAEKAHRQSQKKRSRNKHFLALFRESTKIFEKALAANSWAAEALSALQSAVDTLVKKNILHKNTAARRKSSFAKMLATHTTGSTDAPPVKKSAKTKTSKTAA